MKPIYNYCIWCFYPTISKNLRVSVVFISCTIASMCHISIEDRFYHIEDRFYHQSLSQKFQFCSLEGCSFLIKTTYIFTNAYSSPHGPSHNQVFDPKIAENVPIAVYKHWNFFWVAFYSQAPENASGDLTN